MENAVNQRTGETSTEKPKLQEHINCIGTFHLIENKGKVKIILSMFYEHEEMGKLLCHLSPTFCWK